MPEQSANDSGPSEQAIRYAEMGSLNAHERHVARRGATQAHDPALGLDRSVCLRDVLRWLRAEAMPEGASEPPSAYLLATVEDFEREFGGQG